MTLELFHIGTLLVTALVCAHNSVAMFMLHPPVRDELALIWRGFQAIAFVSALRAAYGAWVVLEHDTTNAVGAGLAVSWLVVNAGAAVALYRRHMTIEHAARRRHGYQTY